MALRPPQPEDRNGVDPAHPDKVASAESNLADSPKPRTRRRRTQPVEAPKSVRQPCRPLVGVTIEFMERSLCRVWRRLKRNDGPFVP